jgi:import inner membrane translocase subunit TIM44
MLDNNVPVFLVTFATQELLLYRNAKTGEAVVGSEDAVDSCRYAIVLTRVDTELENPLTGGWKVVEVSYSNLWSIDLADKQMARRGTKSFV